MAVFSAKLSDISRLENLWFQPPDYKHLDESGDWHAAHTALWFESELLFSIPGIDAVSLSIAGDGGTVIPLAFEAKSEEFSVRIDDVPIALRFRKDLLKPVRKAMNKQPGKPSVWEVDKSRKYVEIELANVSLEINTDGDIKPGADLQVDLPPAMIGDTGVVIEARDISLDLGSGQTSQVQMKKASLYLPGELGDLVGQLTVSDAVIGNGGFTGKVDQDWKTPLSGQLFDVEFALEKVSLAFVQNALTSSSIQGSLKLPFFDAWISAEIAVNLNGAFTVKLAGNNGITTLTIPDALKFHIDSLGFSVKDGAFVALLSGKLEPLIAGLDWPSFEVRELAIDSKGNVRLSTAAGSICARPIRWISTVSSSRS